jgi:hypothetical protein
MLFLEPMLPLTPISYSRRRSVITIGLSMGSQAFQVTMLFPMVRSELFRAFV